MGEKWRKKTKEKNEGKKIYLCIYIYTCISFTFTSGNVPSFEKKKKGESGEGDFSLGLPKSLQKNTHFFAINSVHFRNNSQKYTYSVLNYFIVFRIYRLGTNGIST